MVESFDESCTQPAVLWVLNSTAEAGETFTLKDAAGNVLLSYEPENAAGSIAFSCPGMETGSTYTAAIGSQTQEFTVEQTSVTLGSAGGIAGLPGGGMPGMPGGDEMPTPPGGGMPGMPGDDRREPPATEDDK